MDADVVVIGAGATGCGVARDLAMRGVSVVVVDRGSVNAGTTGRSHGLLHSGARYADSDPEGARECAAESRALKRIGGACVRETGGYVVRLEGDSPDYFGRKLDACRACGVPAEALDGDEARDREPSLSPAAERVIRVPDAVVYPSRLVAVTARSAREHGAEFATGAEVTDVRTEGGRATGVEVEGGGTVEADHVVNAAGAWAGEVAGLAGVAVRMRPTKGVMVVAEHGGLGRVLNRCRPPADGDIVVPHDDHVVLGTTSEPVDDPDDFPREGREAERVVAECAAMLPAVESAPVVGRFWGVRPLYAPEADGDARGISRGFHLLDHGDRDGLAGFTTVVGGKLTTHRLMAEAVSDRVAGRLGVDAPCRTAEEPLPGAGDPAALDRYVREFSADGPADADAV